MRKNDFSKAICPMICFTRWYDNTNYSNKIICRQASKNRDTEYDIIFWDAMHKFTINHKSFGDFVASLHVALSIIRDEDESSQI